MYNVYMNITIYGTDHAEKIYLATCVSEDEAKKIARHHNHEMMSICRCEIEKVC